MTELLLPDEITIPDGIEPIIGWKAFNVHGERLHSPSQGFGWPVKERAEARCDNKVYGWEPVSGIPNIPTEEDGTSFSTMATSSGNIQIQVNPSLNFYGQKDVAINNPMPRVELPAGLRWSWEGHAHDPVSESCGCGIYIGSTVDSCLQYLRYGVGVICKVAMWGRVVQGPYGTRGQYAYPQSIEFAMGLDSKQIVAIAELYGLKLPPSGMVRNPRDGRKFVLVNRVAPVRNVPDEVVAATALAQEMRKSSHETDLTLSKPAKIKWRNTIAGISMILAFWTIISAMILVKNTVVIFLLAGAMLLITVALTVVSDKS